MNTLLILLSGLGAWWLLLAWIVVRSYQERVEAAKIPLTSEEIADCWSLEADLSPKPPTRPWEYVIVGPILALLTFLLLPFYLYAFFLKHRDPYDKHRKI